MFQQVRNLQIYTLERIADINIRVMLKYVYVEKLKQENNYKSKVKKYKQYTYQK